MTKQRSKVRLLKARACLLLAVCLWQGMQQTLATPCLDGELKTLSNGEKKCCPKCISYTGNSHPCTEIQEKECRCPRGFVCADRSCKFCKELPECAEGHELVTHENTEYTFECKPCEIGTYSKGKNSRCQNWTDCESSGLLTIQQGNSTHNAVCSCAVQCLEQARATSDSLYITILAIFTAVALFVLILLTFFLLFCIWSLKKEKHLPADSMEHNLIRLPLALQPSHHREETYSCQFPEEEHGDKTLEEKSSYFCPQSLQ